MTDISELREQMEAAAAVQDFALAAELRDRISILRGQSDGAAPDAIDPTGLTRQKPGSMGLGSSRAHYTPPEGWTPPPKPDLMMKGRGRKGKG